MLLGWTLAVRQAWRQAWGGQARKEVILEEGTGQVSALRIGDGTSMYFEYLAPTVEMAGCVLTSVSRQASGSPAAASVRGTSAFDHFALHGRGAGLYPSIDRWP
ncbi:hypothetical protein MPTK1_8g13020 [Marchantia polymorpha subsp. ruderalis]|uniref:Uncharacterized protein n=1 Tax=Marchantia polymorpha TaxID=3197 RepID=A0A2R6WJL7_MARPO|nr:hypothetical protein MARPO_0083s0019 [Marchantia polymorpha]BBN19717.1 hypothetical protein Mp_8g13020 [Marchantia polymorpha subsp. ruderalis]|eukprot:PTQ34050.1 hypothetical protein MARPO_0083s0019 [Marchantia polymorpha]